MTYWNKLFWALFVMLGATVIAGSFLRVILLDILLGFLVIAIGVLKLNEEQSRGELRGRHQNLNDNIRYLSNMVDNAGRMATRTHDKHESRFLHYDAKHSEIEQKIDDSYDSLAKKMVQMENKLNDVSKAVVEVARRHDTLAKGTSKELKEVEKLKKKTSNMSRKLQSHTKALKAKKRKK